MPHLFAFILVGLALYAGGRLIYIKTRGKVNREAMRQSFESVSQLIDSCYSKDHLEVAHRAYDAFINAHPSAEDEINELSCKLYERRYEIDSNNFIKDGTDGR